METTARNWKLDYPDLTMYQMVARIAKQYPKMPAYEFYGRKTSYEAFMTRIDRAARSMRAINAS